MTQKRYKPSTTSIDSPPNLLPEADYRLKFRQYETQFAFGIPKVALYFTICDPGPFFEVPLARYYNVRSLTGRPRVGGNFIASGWHCDLVLEHIELFALNFRRLDRIPMSHYKGKLILGKVRKVDHRGDQREYPKAVQYSVVARLLSLVDP